ncbi:hypothetical protein B484DRAFT_341544 [Ochromonadaceae sp. CCMP2298]|nr:hypothetical protein B484DRAFT_341544 [Ochromonadaceae sp. CCMP2298]
MYYTHFIYVLYSPSIYPLTYALITYAACKPYLPPPLRVCSTSSATRLVGCRM